MTEPTEGARPGQCEAKNQGLRCDLDRGHRGEHNALIPTFRSPASTPGPEAPPPNPYTIWTLDAPFDKYGVPRMGNVGQSIRHVVVIEAKTFQRLLREHPSLNTAQFRVGSYGEGGENDAASDQRGMAPGPTLGSNQAATPPTTNSEEAPDDRA